MPHLYCIVVGFIKFWLFTIFFNLFEGKISVHIKQNYLSYWPRECEPETRMYIFIPFCCCIKRCKEK